MEMSTSSRKLVLWLGRSRYCEMVGDADNFNMATEARVGVEVVFYDR